MNLMIDLETGGIRPTSAIIAIGVVPFDEKPVYDDLFYKKIDIADSTMLGFTTDESTMKWWNQQDQKVREEAFSGTEDVRTVLTDLKRYSLKFGTNVNPWGNGADFDLVLLANHYEAMNLASPWKFWDHRCFRTLKALVPSIPYVKPTIAHNALQDALAQAIHAVKCLNWIGGPK